MHFLALLNKQSGSGSPANSYTQTVSCNNSSFGKILTVLIILTLIVCLVYSCYKKAATTSNKNHNATIKKLSGDKNQIEQDLYKKMHLLDSTDLSKIDDLVDALLTTEKYSNPPKENSQESD